MKQTEVSRRAVMGVLGAGAAAAATTAAGHVLAKPLAHGAPSGSPARVAPTAQEQATAQGSALLAPLQPGDTLDRWTVEAIHPVDRGALSVVLGDAAGRHFQLDVCARDDGAEVPGPGRTEAFEVYLANHGDGSTSTYEDHGLAAMALAEIIRANEHHVDRSRFMTLAERLRQDAARVHVG